jgi:hypothetical protein
MQSQMFGCVQLRWLRCRQQRIQRPVLESTYRMLVELDPSTIPAHTLPLPYKHTNSYVISFENTNLYFQPVAEVMVHST